VAPFAPAWSSGVSVTQPVNNPRAQRRREGSGVRFMAPCSSPCGVGGIPGQAAAPGAVTPRGHGRARLPTAPPSQVADSARKGSRWRPLPGAASAGSCRAHGRRTPVRPSEPQRSQPSGPGGGGRTASCPPHLSAFGPSVCPLSSRELGLHSSACAQGLLIEQQTSGKGGGPTPHPWPAG
jgi:hypothetical protein